jgi:2',3'-cyclic-nucleotide 2'-phosphodiesterase (5'-nucleotidase family)
MASISRMTYIWKEKISALPIENMRKASKTILLPLFNLLLFTFLSCSPQLGYQFQGDFQSIDVNVEQDPDFVRFISPYKEQMEAEMNTIIGTSAKALTRSRGESLLGNLVSDLQREFAEQQFGLPIDISIINNGGMRNDLPEGNITLGNIYELSPFDNYLMILELNSKDVKKLGEFMAQRKNMSVSGMEISGKGNELQSLQINGKPLEEGKTYLLAINDYLANGGDNMDFLINLPVKESSNILLRDMLIDMIKFQTAKGEKLDAGIEGRQKYN